MLGRRSIDGLALILRPLVMPLSLGLRGCIALEWRLLTVALPVAAAAAAATPAATAPALAGFTFTELSVVLSRRLLPRTVLFGQAAVMLLVRDGVLGDGVVRDCWHTATQLAAASPSAASAPAPAAAFTFPAFATGFALPLGCREFGTFFLLIRCGEVPFGFVCRDRNLRLLGGKIACCLGCVHLFAAIDHVGLLPGYRRVG